MDARLLNIEIVSHPEIHILISDVNGTMQNSPEMAKSVVAAAESAGVPHKVQAASRGVGTDAVFFSRVGLKVPTLVPLKVPQQTVAIYHQKWDTPEMFTINPMLNVLKLTLEWISCSGE